MESTLNNPLLTSITHIYENRDDLFKNTLIIENLSADFKTVTDFLLVDDKTAAVLSIIICEQIMGDGKPFKKTLKILGFSPLDFIFISNKFKELKKKGWVRLCKKRYNSRSEDIEIAKELMDAIMYNNIEKLIIYEPKNLSEALLQIRNFTKNIIGDFYQDELIEATYDYIERLTTFPYINQILEEDKLEKLEKVILIWLSAENIFNKEEFDLDNIIEMFSEDHSVSYSLKQRIINHESIIMKDGYLEYLKPNLADFSSVKLGDRLTDLLNVHCPKMEHVKVAPKYCQLIDPNDVETQQLLFNDNNKKSIDDIINLTSESKYLNLTKKFTDKGMKPGLTMLFYGLPGTGKTELVKQISKTHNRAIFQVEMSAIKDMFVGNSEKNLKRVFKDYSDAVKQYKITPILLFNEADAILGKRNLVQNAVDQMLNSMQNILLQELEDFKGIFIATTNLIENIDGAFDRRLLYKLKFENPNDETRYKILQNQFANINNKTLKLISTQHQLSGGQIQNIKKKFVIDQLLFENNSNISNKLIDFIEEETQFRSITKNKIGFNK
jgi:AAA+ superfamily predicted ATPase